MRGTIIAANMRLQRFAVRTDHGDITVFDLTDSIDLETGDEVSGHLHSLGGETLTRLSDKEEFSVFIQDVFCSDSRAAALLAN